MSYMSWLEINLQSTYKTNQYFSDCYKKEVSKTILSLSGFFFVYYFPALSDH